MKWRRTINKLPKESGRYWCFVQELNDLGFSYFQWNCYFDVEEKYWADKNNFYNVTHWMPLAKPPKRKRT